MLHICSIFVFIFLLIRLYILRRPRRSWVVNLGGVSNNFNEISFFVDSVSVLFGAAVRFVIINVFVFAFGYMHRDRSKKYFFFPLSVFRGRMVVLIFSGDVSTLFLA